MNALDEKPIPAILLSLSLRSNDLRQLKISYPEQIVFCSGFFVP
jgi:hypothetical protein